MRLDCGGWHANGARLGVTVIREFCLPRRCCAGPACVLRRGVGNLAQIKPGLSEGGQSLAAIGEKSTVSPPPEPAANRNARFASAIVTAIKTLLYRGGEAGRDAQRLCARGKATGGMDGLVNLFRRETTAAAAAVAAIAVVCRLHEERTRRSPQRAGHLES
jgi:hypothetical protein